MHAKPQSRSLLRLLVILAGLVAGALPCSALDPSTPLQHLLHDSWRMEQGLPQNTVAAVLQARDGYLWAGTQEGVARYDGVRFVVFDRSNTPELGHNTVWRMLEDRSGNVWIGTVGGGLTRYDGKGFRRFAEADGLPSLRIAWLFQDRRGRLWVGTDGEGLVRLEGERFVREPAAEGLRGRFVKTVSEDAAGALWIGTDAGVSRLEDGRLHALGAAEGIPEGGVIALAPARDGGMWIGTERSGVLRLARGQAAPAEVLTQRHGLANDLILALLADRAGSLWITTSGGGLHRLHAGRIEAFEPLRNVSVRALVEDREGALWMGTLAGVHRLRDTPFGVRTTRDGLVDNDSNTVMEDTDGSLWIGSSRGLTHFAGGTATVYGTKDGIGGEVVSSVLRARDGTLWIATLGGGLSRLLDRRIDTLTTRDGLPNDWVQALEEDEAGGIWIGTRRGVTRYQDGRFHGVEADPGLAVAPVPVLRRDREGAIWIGTHGRGVRRLHRGGITAWTTKDGLSNDSVVALHEDAAGSMWVGTYGGGVTRIRGGRAAAITTAQGLADDNLMQILDDGRGFLWFMSNTRIFRVPRQELDDVAEGRRKTVTSTVFGKSDGIRSFDFNGGWQPAGARTRDGRLWFPTVHGVAVADPSRLSSVPAPPPVTIEDVLVDGRVAPRSSKIVVPPQTQTVEIQYTALELSAPGKVSFRYLLEGFDQTWIEAGSRRTAYYTHVPPGSYRFRMAARTGPGDWTEAAPLALEVVPRWHQTGWFRLAAALAAVLALAGTYRARVWQHRARERELVAIVDERTHGLRDALIEAEAAGREADAQRARAEQANEAKSAFLANMSHELRTPLNGVLGFAGLMDRAGDRRPEDRRHLAAIRRSGEHLLGLIDDVLSLSKIEAGRVTLAEQPFDLPALIQGLEEMLTPRAEARDLELVVHRHPGLPPVVVGDAGRLRQILINLLGNAVKFTDGSRVDLRVGWAAGRATFEVEDTGPGIAAEEQEKLFQAFVQTAAGRQAQEGTGLGLALSRQLARLMGGDITVESALGRGSRFRVEVDLPAAPEGTQVPGHGDQRRVRALAPGQPERRILVTDDVRANRSVLAELLTSVGFVVREAAGGEEAIALWRSFRPHLVFMDMRMPGLDGIETIRRIRADETARGLPRTCLIGLSASALEQDRDRALAAGADDFLSKPTREGQLFDRIVRHLRVTYVWAEDADHVADASAGQRTPVAAATRFAPGQDVLVVDDNPVNRELARALLGRAGLRVAEARNGREALERVRASSFDAVLLDIGMPGMDGVATLRALRAEPGLARVPVIALTAHVQDGDRERFLTAGADGYLAKPVDPDALLAALDRWLRQGDAAHVAAPAPAAAAAMPRLPGFDVESGVRRLDGDGPLYLSLVRSWTERLASVMQRVEAAFAAGDREALMARLHDLRGSAATIAAARVAKAAGRMEDAASAGGSALEMARLREAVAEVLGGASETRKAGPADHPLRAEPAAAGRPRVLVVDDQPVNVAVIEKALGDRYALSVAHDAATALDAARSGVDLVLLDVMMPDVDGFALCRLLKAEAATRRVPVIFVTALREADQETVGFAAGGADYLTKPINAPVLRARVQTHVELKLAHDRLEGLALIDALTGIGNRRRFDAVLQHEWQRAQRSARSLTLAMVDLDHFKAYNDRYGHARGDECLRAVAQALAAACRRPGDSLTRYGGEEFAMVLPEVDPAGARIVLEAALAGVHALDVEHAGAESGRVTISIGAVTLVPAPGQTAESGLATADQLLYDAKALGRDRAVLLDPSLATRHVITGAPVDDPVVPG